MDVTSALTGGGAGTLVLALAYGYQQWAASRRDKRKAPVEATSSAVTDAAAANSLLLASLREEREETQRLSAEVAELRTQNAALYQQMRQQRKDYEREVAGLREQLEAIQTRLGKFESELRTDPEAE